MIAFARPLWDNEPRPSAAEPWQPCRPPAVAPLRRVAVHEAGHVVAMAYFGLDSPGAAASAEGGQTLLPADLIDQAAQACAGAPAEWQAGVRAAAVCHAGPLAVLLETGTLGDWRGPLATWALGLDDFLKAGVILHTAGFSLADSAAGHAAAQRLAAHILTLHWPEVQRVADALALTGHWTPDQGAGRVH